jgi:hypothetical protein
MGLDATFSIRRTIIAGAGSTEQEQEQYAAIMEALDVEPSPHYDHGLIEVRIAVGYLRKVWAVHDWIAKSQDKDSEDLTEAYLGRDTLQRLIADLAVAVALPTEVETVFDGVWTAPWNTYGEGWLSGMKEALEMLVDLRARYRDDTPLIYRASW